MGSLYSLNFSTIPHQKRLHEFGDVGFSYKFSPDYARMLPFLSNLKSAFGSNLNPLGSVV